MMRRGRWALPGLPRVETLSPIRSESAVNPDSSGAAAVGRTAYRTSILVHAAWLALFGVVFAPTLAWLWHRWTLGIWYNGHGILIPFILAYLLYDYLRRDPASKEDSSPWGFLFLGAGLLLVVADAAIQTQLMSALGFVVCLPGLSLLLLGRKRTRALVFPLLLAPFMLPIPAGFVAGVHLLLRRITAWGTTHAIEILGIPVLREDTMLFLPRGAIGIVDACSGFSTLYAAITLSFILSFMTHSNARRVSLIIGAWVLAILCNTLRVSTLVLLFHNFGTDPLRSYLHELSGMMSFAVALALLFMIAGRKSLQQPPRVGSP